MNSPRLTVLFMVGALASPAADPSAAGTDTTIKMSLVPLVNGDHRLIASPDGSSGLVASPDQRHVAYVFRQEDGRRAVALDGQPGRLYDWILGKPVFSADGQHVAYAAASIVDRKLVWRIVIDGVEGKPYDRIFLQRSGVPLLFSRDGRHFAYSATSRRPPVTHQPRHDWKRLRDLCRRTPAHMQPPGRGCGNY